MIANQSRLISVLMREGAIKYAEYTMYSSRIGSAKRLVMSSVVAPLAYNESRIATIIIQREILK